jgi:hypothetical protein
MSVKFTTAETKEVRSADGKHVYGSIIRDHEDKQWVFSPRLYDLDYWDLEMISHQLRVMNGAVQ